MNHADMQIALGAYALGALEPAEYAEVTVHLEDCASCRAELADFAPLPGLLGRLTAEQAKDTTESVVPDGPLRGALVTVAARRRARRWRLVAAAAAVVAIAGVGAGVVVANQHDTPAGLTVSATAPGGRVQATAVLREGSSGTTIALTMQGVPADERCRLIAVARDGHREVAGSWRASYTGGVSFNSSTAISRGDLARLDVVTFTGRKLVTIPVT